MNNDPEAVQEFYNLWIKMFEKTSEDILEESRLASPIKEMMEPVKSALRPIRTHRIRCPGCGWIRSAGIAPKV